jgi:hypothetical protein
MISAKLGKAAGGLQERRRSETRVSLKDGAGMHGGETAETAEIRHIQREYMA